MSIKTRYDFIKRKHKDYLIIFNERNHYFSCDNDQELLKELKFSNNLKDLEKRNINYMVFTNVEKIKTFQSKDNNYMKYCKMIKIKKVIEKLVCH